MRNDMRDVIIDTGRIRGPDWPRTRISSMDVDRLDLLPERQAMHKSWDTSLGDRTGPLYRYLERQTGRPWTKVWSEICTKADRRTIRGYHLRDHVFSYVHGSGGEDDIKLRYHWRPFFVDRHGILRKDKHRPRWRRQVEQRPDECAIDGRQYRCVNGCWFEVWTEKVSVTVRRGYSVYYATEDREHKRQLSKKELRSLRLQNKLKAC